MALSPGQQLLQYRIAEKIGEGAMGVVYRATDETLGRDVAIKILPAEFQADRDRLARFEREARTLAALSHPDIAAIYGLHEASVPAGAGDSLPKPGTPLRFLAMELASGEDLAERLARGPLPIDEALPIAARIAKALDYAHERGIVHRDLKPANIKLSPGGGVKILDFGLAKAIEGDPAASAPRSSGPGGATLTSAGTGAVVGTAAYMSPEQARGQSVDRRTDVWAFGCILYEILTARRAFPGDTITDTLAGVLRAEPDYALLPAATPAPVARVLRRCLVKDASRRLRAVGDAALELDDAHETASRVEPGPLAPAPPPRAPLAWVAGALVLGILGTLVAAKLAGGTAPPTSGNAGPMSFRQLTFTAGGESEPAITPDGESFAYVKVVNGQSDVFVQRIDGRNPINVTASCGQDDGEPAFSPDGKHLALRTECEGGGIVVMGATGEAARRVADFGHSPAWSPDGTELAVVTEIPTDPTARNTTSQLFAVRVETGEKRLVSEHDSMHPSWSPDGRRIAIWGLRGDTSQRDLWTVAADGSQKAAADAVTVTDDAPIDWNPVWAPDGKSLYFSSTRGGTFNLWRVGVDSASGASTGAPEAITAPSSWAGWISVARDGRRIVFTDRNAKTAILVAPVDAAGRITGPLASVPIGSIEANSYMGISPDGTSIAFANAGLPQHLFVVGTDGSGLRQLTDGAHRDRQPVFSPDGKWIAFQTDRFGGDLAVIRVDGAGLRSVTTGLGRNAWVPFWTLDGSRLFAGAQEGPFTVEFETGKGSSVTRLPNGPDGMNFWPGSLSPDGRMVAGALFREGEARSTAVLTLADGTYRQWPVPRTSRPQFTADGRHLVLDAEGDLELLDVTTGKVEALLRPPAGRFFGFLILSADRRRLAFLEIGDESDIWLATLGGAEPPKRP